LPVFGAYKYDINYLNKSAFFPVPLIDFNDKRPFHYCTDFFNVFDVY